MSSGEAVSGDHSERLRIAAKLPSAVTDLSRAFVRRRKSAAYIDPVLLWAMRNPGCPICEDRPRHERNYFFYYLYEGYAELAALEEAASSQGFCDRHARHLLNAFGAELAIATVHRHAAGKIRAALANDRAIPTLASPAMCPACRSHRAHADLLIQFAANILDDGEHCSLYGDPALLCMKHLRMVMPAVSDEVFAHLLEVHSAALSRVSDHWSGSDQTDDDAFETALRLTVGHDGASNQLPHFAAPDASSEQSPLDPVASLAAALDRSDACPICREIERAWLDWMGNLEAAASSGDRVEDLVPTCPEHVGAAMRHAGRALQTAVAVRFIVLLGVVSLFGDMTYEGARSIVGPYLATLGATGTAVGVIAGLGELVGYTVRLVSGYIGDRTGRYWTVTIVGYLFNLFAVPALALVSGWQGAAALIVAERMGRGLRTPTRDAMLSHASTQTGAGWAFGLHEAMDTAGAVMGPLAVSVALYLGQGYRMSFAMLLVPAALSIGVLLIARSQFPAPRDLETTEVIDEPMALPLNFWIYSAGAAFIGAGFADFSLIAYHFGKTAVVAAAWVPVFYAAAMISAAVAALLLGRAFDRIGIRVMALATIASAISAPLVFLGGPMPASAGVLCWGVGMGAQESVMRAAIGSMANTNHRATAYGLFHMIFGVAWFLGSALLGVLYDYSIPALAMVSFFLQLMGIPILLMSKRLEAWKE